MPRDLVETSGISTPRFWDWFDRLPRMDRDAMNYAGNQEELRDIAYRVWSFRR